MNVLLSDYDRDLQEWDICLWQLLQQLSAEDAIAAEESFGIDHATALLISELSPSHLRQLSSGVISSFKPVFPESRFIELFNEPYNPAILIDEGYQGSDLDANYWILLSKSDTHHATSALRYGVTKEVAKLVSSSTTSQVRSIASRLGASFHLRFPHECLVDLLEASPRAALMRKAAHCLVH